EALSKAHPGFFSITGRDRSDSVWTVAYRVDDGPVAYYVYHRGERKADFLFLNQPAIQKYRLAPMTPIVIPARDGLKLVSYLTVPPGVVPKHLPTVLLVHGGPWARDHWGIDPAVQWLANRGYAVLQVNFRGSTGFGKKFLNAANGQWGIGSMQHDLTDAVQWAIKNDIADPRRVAVFGGSYGGYATLAGLTFTPELYACGVDLVGPSNLRTLLQSIPPYWALEKYNFTLRIGNVEEDDELNRKLSPLFHVDKIRAPLLIGQGANDPRVNIRESDQIVQAMRARNLPVIYAVCPDEGHGFMRPENRLDFFGRAEEFLSKYLGGRHEAWKEVKGSSLELR
ncbi:MAG: S9 family peptidase, partial [Armatimonadetes bacterium]|nr:S9 family peptidase [Armatimonadota bacterium]